MDGVVETRSNLGNGTELSDWTPEHAPPATRLAPGGDPSPESTEEKYPPTRDAILILCAVAMAMFLISLVSSSSSPTRQPNSIIHRTE
jgi:hypothetical protein